MFGFDYRANKKFKVPKYFVNHPAIKIVECGWDNGSDYKYEIVLNDGWQFVGWRSVHMGFFNSVSEFKIASPTFFGA